MTTVDYAPEPEGMTTAGPKIKAFRVIVRRWLFDAGYIPCQKCHLVKPFGNYPPRALKRGHAKKICRTCLNSYFRDRDKRRRPEKSIPKRLAKILASDSSWLEILRDAIHKELARRRDKLSQ